MREIKVYGFRFSADLHRHPLSRLCWQNAPTACLSRWRCIRTAPRAGVCWLSRRWKPNMNLWNHSRARRTKSLPNKSLLATVRSIRRQSRFDVAILFPNSLRAALEIWLSGISRRVGYSGHFRSWLLNQIVPDRGIPGPIEHQADGYLRMARELGA